MREPGAGPVVREFGKAYPGVPYRPRPAVYAVIDRGDGRIAVMRVNDQAFLPGGGAELGETWEETIRREVREEMGWSVDSLQLLARTTEFLQPTAGRGPTRVEATFVRARLVEHTTEPVEADHFLDWLHPEDAAEVLTHRSHVWIAEETARGRWDGE